MTLDKESRIYRKVLLRGVGECVTMLTTETARRKFRPLVEWACRRALGYDPQIEDSRALLIYDLINHYADANPFIDVVEKRFFSSMRKSDGHWLFVQECELLALFSINGNRRARRILERGYDVLYGRLCRIRSERIAAPYIPEPDNFAALCEQLLLDAKTVAAQSIFGRIAKDGALGKLISLETRVHGSNGIPGDWRKVKAEGGGMLYDWGVHIIDQMLYFNGYDVDRVFCTLDYLTGCEVDDGCFIDIFFKGGVRARVEICTYNFIPLPLMYARFTEGTAKVDSWGSDVEIVQCNEWKDHGIMPVKTASGLSKTMAPRSEHTIEKYTLEKELGHGGMGGVYLGHDNMLDRKVAIKVMLKSYG